MEKNITTQIIVECIDGVTTVNGNKKCCEDNNETTNIQDGKRHNSELDSKEEEKKDINKTKVVTIRLEDQNIKNKIDKKKPNKEKQQKLTQNKSNANNNQNKTKVRFILHNVDHVIELEVGENLNKYLEENKKNLEQNSNNITSATQEIVDEPKSKCCSIF